MVLRRGLAAPWSLFIYIYIYHTNDVFEKHVRNTGKTQWVGLSVPVMCSVGASHGFAHAPFSISWEE